MISCLSERDLEQVSSDVRVAFALFDAEEPLTLMGISRRSGMTPQHVKYHLDRLVESGVIIPLNRDGNKLYTLQPFFYGDVRDSLYRRFHPIVSDIAANMVFDHIDANGGRRDVALVNSLRMFIALFSIDLDRLPMFQR